MWAVTSYGRFGAAALVLPQVRVALPLEERLREAARRLLHPDDERPRLVAAACRLERRPGPLHLHLAQAQHLDEPGDGRGVALPGGHDEGERLASATLARRFTASAVRSQCSRFAAACSRMASEAWSCVSTMSASRHVPPGHGAGKLAEAVRGS